MTGAMPAPATVCRRMRLRALSMLLAIAAAGCAGLPPKPQPAALSAAAPVSGLNGGGADWPSPDWWRRYRDPTLDRLIDLALESSPTLASAHARFEAARQSVRIASSAAGANLQASGDFSRQRLSDNGLFPPALLGFTWYNQADLGLKASYTFDWWGKQRALVEAAMDEAHASQAERSAAALLLASSVADTYFGWQADQSRLVLTRDRERVLAQVADIDRARVAAEFGTFDESDHAESALAADREQIAALEGSAALRIVALAALVGCSPSELPSLEVKSLPPVYGALPDDVRIDLISRRADITASRWRALAAEKNRAAARAEFFPDVSINALAGLQSITTDKLLEYGSRVPNVGAAIHLPLFDAGRLQAHYGAAQTQVDAAVASYRDTVVGAARDVATQAATLTRIAAERSQRTTQLDAAISIQERAAARVRQGVADPRAELSAADSRIEQQDALLQLDAAALSANIGLIRALGGGFETKGDTP